MPNNITKLPLKRKAITLDTKIKMLDLLRKGEKISSVAKSYGMNESTVRTIKKNEEATRKSVMSGSQVSSNFSSYTRDVAIEMMEKALMMWIEDHTQKRIPIDSISIKHKAVRLYNTIKENDKSASSTNEKTCNFTASKGWFERFKKRHSLHNLKIQGELASGDENAAKKFIPIFKKIIQENNYTPDQIFNADETGLNWKKMPSRTYLAKSEKSACGFKAAIDCVTLLFCSNASGDQMMKPLLINRAINPRAMKGMNKKHLPVHWTANKKAWMTASIFVDWFQNCFVPEAEIYMKKKNLPFKVLLLLDNAPGHPREIQHPNVEVVFLPPNTTAFIQPLDQGIINTFKTFYIKQTFEKLLTEMDNDRTLTVPEVWKKFTILDCVKHVGLAYKEIRPTTLNACWRQIWPEVVSNDNVLISNKDEFSKIINLSKSLGGEGFEDLNKNDIEELFTDEVITEDELLRHISAYESDNDSINESVEPSLLTEKNLYEVMQLVSKLEGIVLKIDPNMERALTFQRDLRNTCAQYEEIYKELIQNKKQSKITDFFKKPVSEDSNKSDDE